MLALLYHFPLQMLSLLPTSLPMSMADLAHYLGNLMARRAENISNECVERVECEREKEKPRVKVGGILKEKILSM